MGSGAGRVLLYVVTEDWYFMSHRLPMARAARDAGWDVHVAARVIDHGTAIEAEGFTLHPLVWQRASLSPLALGQNVLALRRLYGQLKPQIIHHVALKPTVIGGLASIGLIPEPTCVNSLAGFGFVFTSKRPLARLLKVPVRLALGFLLNRQKTVNIVQNPDDYTALQDMDVSVSRIELIPGSGVDVEVLRPKPEPEPPIRIGFVGRLLEDKGVRTLIKAHLLLRTHGLEPELHLAGTPDPANPTSISQSELNSWSKERGVTLCGHVADIGKFWAGCHIAVLPSRREGMPKSLLEAAACGRPIVATDVPGCREVARPGVNALLVPMDDPQALADALARLCGDKGLRAALGMGGRRLVEENFSSERIGAATVALYQRATLVSRWMNA
ncbi:glycosyl transferase family 1 [Agaricicola taiwanensis]|uniref:Glycosyl transferase family 1 n=2 Tax=Agaricicola taiwanensis TaxID=591372 RepID=A0A8J2VNK0_9RHOB|nr:glycosyl transferase family 1 [Agaricicola taiwanensis]